MNSPIDNDDMQFYKNNKGQRFLQKGQIAILDQYETVKLIIRQYQSPGDILMLTAAIRDLQLSYPDKFQIDVRTPCDALFENNPYLTPLDDNDPDVFFIEAEYPMVHQSNECQYHFIHAFRKDLEAKLGLSIKPTDFKGDIHISNQEKHWYSQIYDLTQKNLPFWIIDAGCKSDYTAKLWEIARFQQVVNALPEITFVQIGATEHFHKALRGENVINLIGKTDLRQLVRLFYWSAGVITPVSFPMHLAAAVEMHPMYQRKYRPCIVIAGGREPSQWEAYPYHQYLHTCGMLRCCANGGCWKSRITKLNDGSNKDDCLCEQPVHSTSGQVIPKCMDMIQSQQVINLVKNYMDDYNFHKDIP